MKQPTTQENNPDAPPALADATGYAWGDKCPDCGQPMDCDMGQRMTSQEPEINPCVYCPDCGTKYPMTHNDKLTDGSAKNL